MFAQQRLAQGHGVKLADIGADRQTVDRRRADDARSRTPDRDSCKVRGIGVAVSVSTCTSVRIALAALCAARRNVVLRR